MFDVLKIVDKILSWRNSEKSEIFFDEVYPPKICLTKFFVANVFYFSKMYINIFLYALVEEYH